MATISRSFEFDSGHRILGHEGKCKFLHGHRYKVVVIVEAPELDDLGRVIDFGVLKRTIGGWIDERLDHNLLLNPDDPLVNNSGFTKWFVDVNGGKPFLMPDHIKNPTAENIARLIFDMSRHLLSHTVISVSKVVVYETPNCSAEYHESD